MIPKQQFKPGVLPVLKKKLYPFKKDIFAFFEMVLYPVRFSKVSAQAFQAKRLINSQSVWLRRT